MTDTFTNVHDGDTADGIRFGLVGAQENTDGGKHNTAMGAEQTETTEALVHSINPKLGPSPGGEPFGRNVNLLETSGGNSFNVLQNVLLGIPVSGYGTTVQAPTVSPDRRVQESKLHEHRPAEGLYTPDGKPTAKLLQGVERVKLVQEAWANYQDNATSDPNLTPAEDFKRAVAELYDSDPHNFLDGNAYLKRLHGRGTAGITAVPDSTTPLPRDPRNIVEQTLGAIGGQTANTATHRVQSPLGVIGSAGGIGSDISDKLNEWGAKASPEDPAELEQLKKQFSEQDLKATEQMPLPQRVAHLKSLSVKRANMAEMSNLAGADSFKAQAFGLVSMLPGMIATDGVLGLAGKGATSAFEYADSIAAKKVVTKYEADLAAHINTSRASIEANKAANIPFLMQEKVAQDATLRAAAEADITIGVTPQAAASKWATRQKEALWQLTPKTLQDNLVNNAAYWDFGYKAAIKSPAMLYGFTEATETVHGFVFNEDKTEGFHHLTPEEYGMGLAFGLLGHGAAPAYKHLTAKFDRVKKLQEELGINEGTTAGYKQTKSGAVIDADAKASLQEVNSILQSHYTEKKPFSPEQIARLDELQHVKKDLQFISKDLEKDTHYQQLQTELDKGIPDAELATVKAALEQLKDPGAEPLKMQVQTALPGGTATGQTGIVLDLLSKLKQGETRTETAAMLKVAPKLNAILKVIDTGHAWVQKGNTSKKPGTKQDLSPMQKNQVQAKITSLKEDIKDLPPAEQTRILETIAHHQLLRSDLVKDLDGKKMKLADNRPVNLGADRHLIDTSKLTGDAYDKAVAANEYLSEVHKRFNTDYQGTYFDGQVFKDLLATPDWRKAILEDKYQGVSHALEYDRNIREWLDKEGHPEFVEELHKDFTYSAKEQKFKLKEEDRSITEADPLPEGVSAPKQDPEGAVC